MNETNTASSSTASTQQQPVQRKTIRLVVMGGGYDTRSIKLLEQSLLMHGDNATTSTQYNLLQRKHGQSQRRRRRRWYHRLLKRSNNKINNDDSTTTRTGNAFINITNTNYNLQAYELDLPEVVTAKRKLLLQRLFRRRPWLQSTTTTGVKRNKNGVQKEEEEEEFPILKEANFNDLNATRKILEGILLNDDGTSKEDEEEADVTNIILFEGVMIYLDKGVPHALLELCSDVLRKCSSNNNSSGSSSESSTTTKATLGYLCFADRLENIPGGDEEAAQLEMECTGWELVDFLSKPGLARHMGVARVVV